jgi:hypothetical protein
MTMLLEKADTRRRRRIRRRRIRRRESGLRRAFVRHRITVITLLCIFASSVFAYYVLPSHDRPATNARSLSPKPRKPLSASRSRNFDPGRPDDDLITREFRAIADRLYSAGPGSIYGRSSIKHLSEILERGGLVIDAECALKVKLATEYLRIGKVSEAIEHVDAVIAAVTGKVSPIIYARLIRIRALVHLREAEISNCVKRHNKSCCILPLQNGGVHTVAEPIKQAHHDYLQFLEQYPGALDARWLVNVTAMATGDYPHNVPDQFLIPQDYFASKTDIGRFSNIAPDLGLSDLNLAGGTILEDFDNDGFLDIVTSTCDPAGPLVYHQNEGDGTWSDRTESARLAGQLGGLNCIAGDYNNDGYSDILVLRGGWMLDEGCIRNSLLRNNGDGTFADVTRISGLAEPAMPTQAAAWLDYDGDGHLDLFVGNESRRELDPNHLGDYPSQLFHNNGDGTFVDMAASAGVTNDRYCKGVAVGDYDNDGDLDIYCSNIGRNRLYRNNGDGTFTDVAAPAGVTGPAGRTFATWFFDFDNDGWLDIFVAAYDCKLEDFAADALNLPHRAKFPSLYRNNRDGTFTDVAVAKGLGHPYLPMGANFGDFDNDGWLDIYLGTGNPDYETLTPNVALRNDAAQTFQDITMSAGLGHLQKGHGIAFGDWDRDGDQDIFLQLGGFYEGDKYQNVLFDNPGHGRPSLVLQLQGERTNRSGYGARIKVVVQTPDGRRTIHRAVGSVSSFGGSPQRQEIGLGNATAIEKVEIFWPHSSYRHELTDLSLNTAYQITEGKDSPRQLPYDALH